MSNTNMKPEKIITSREIIKPSTPTPPHLRIYKLCFFDQLIPQIYLPLVFFYPNSGSGSLSETADISRRLKNSLSETLTKYYPLAGRIKDGVSVECNDEGADYFEARFKCSLSEILQQPTTDTSRLFFQADLPWSDSGTGSILVVEVSFFDCGGIAIAACASHKIVDACTQSNFMRNWANVMCQSGHEEAPEFVGASIFPPNDLFVPPKILIERGNSVSRRLVFKASKIAELKAMADNSGVQNPTRVEVVAALIYKCAMAAARANLRISTPFALMQTVNLRKRVVPPLSENLVGNLVGNYFISTMEGQTTELHTLVAQMREGMLQYCNKYAKNLKGEEWFFLVCESMKEQESIFKNENHLYICSSFCRFPLYQVDFGWGKPIWVSSATTGFKNGFCMMDTRSGDGIEAWLGLEKCEMAVFERDEEILAFASLDPSVLDLDY